MPFTPFHLGPALLLYALFSKLFDITLFISSIVLDIEPFLILALGLDANLHGFFHSFLGGTIIAFVLLAFFIVFEKQINSILEKVNIRRMTKPTIIASVFAGIYLHIFMDSFLYTDIKPFYPIEANPLYSLISSFDIYLFCVICFFIGAAILVYKALKK